MAERDDEPTKIQQDIEETRERLAATIDQLSEKMAPRNQAAEHKSQLAIAGAVVLVVVVALVLRRRRD